MANWSQTDVEIFGPPETIKEALTDIESKREGNEGSFQYLVPNKHSTVRKDGYNSMELGSIESTNVSITVNGSGRWAGPDKYFASLFEQYALTGSYTDSEAGCDFFYRTEFIKGKLITEKEEKYFSDASIKYFGIDFFVEHYAHALEDEDWEENWEDEIKIFKKYGYSVADLEKAWETYT